MIPTAVYLAVAILVYALGVRHKLRHCGDRVNAWLLPYFTALLWPVLLPFWPFCRREGLSFFWLIDQ